MSRDSEAAKVARELDARLDDLRAAVAALSAVLIPPAEPDDAQDGKEAVSP